MNHTQLIDYQQNQNSINTRITQKEQRIETEKQINASLKREKEKMEARNELVKRVSILIFCWLVETTDQYTYQYAGVWFKYTTVWYNSRSSKND